MAVAGIHFGNTNSVVAVCKDGKVETVSNELGDRMTPTIVAYTGNEKIVGQHAKAFLTRNPHSCITNIKASIGNSFHDKTFEDVKAFCSCQVTNKHGEISHNIKLDDAYVSVTTAKAMSYIFTQLLEIAESFGGDDLEDVVLATPLAFSDQQKMSITEAAESIGFNVLRIISEPSAALLAHGIGQNDSSESCNVLVFRLGGTSSDATLVRVNSGMYHVIAENRKTHFGAKSFDDVLVNNFASEFKKKYKMDITDNKKAMNKLRTSSEDCKKALSRLNITKLAVDSLYDGMDFHTSITRVKFESLSALLITQCMDVVEELLKTNNFSKENIQKVVLVGGGTCIPKLISAFKSSFPSSEVLDNKTAEEVIAHGAALQASILQAGNEDHIPKLRCLSRNIGIKISNAKFEVLLSQDTPTPTSYKKSFKVLAQQTSVVLPIYESELPSMENAKLLAKIVMRDLPAKDEDREMELNIQVNKLGGMVVVMSNEDGRKESINIPNDVSH